MSALGTWLRTAFVRVRWGWLSRRVSIGRRLRVQCRLEIKGPGRVSLGDDCRLLADPWGADFVTLFTHRPEARLAIGHRVTLRATRVGCFDRVEIGDDACVECASVYDSDFHNVDASKRDDPDEIPVRAVEIGPAAYVGCECLCGKGSVIGAQAVLLPGTVISTKAIPVGGLAAGNPGRVRR